MLGRSSVLRNGAFIAQRALSNRATDRIVDSLDATNKQVRDIKKEVIAIKEDNAAARRAAASPDVTPLSLMFYTYTYHVPVPGLSGNNREENRQDYENEWNKWHQQSRYQRFYKLLLAMSTFGLPGGFAIQWSSSIKKDNDKMGEFSDHFHEIDFKDGLLREEMREFCNGIYSTDDFTPQRFEQLNGFRHRYKESQDMLENIISKEANYIDDFDIFLPWNYHLTKRHKKFEMETKLYKAYMSQELERTYAVVSPYISASDTDQCFNRMRDLLFGKEVDGHQMLIHNEEGVDKVVGRTLDTYVAITTAENKYPEAINMLGVLFIKSDGKNKAIMSVDTSPAYLLTRIASQIMRFQAHGNKFTLDENLQSYSGKEIATINSMKGDELFFYTGNEAEKFLKKSIKVNPNFPESYNLLAVLNMRYMDVMKHDKTSEEYKNAKKAAYDNIQKAIGLAPNNPVFKVNRAKFFGKMGDYKEALHDAQQVIEGYGANQAAFMVIVNSLYHLGDFKGAREALYSVKLDFDTGDHYLSKPNVGIDKHRKTDHIQSYEDYSIAARVLAKSSKPEDIEKSKRFLVVANYYGRPNHNGLAAAVKRIRERKSEEVQETEERSTGNYFQSAIADGISYIMGR